MHYKELGTQRFNIRKDKWLVIYMFLAIFQPPFIPIPFIYLLGAYTFIWLYYKTNITAFNLLRESQIIWIAKLFLFFFFYIMIFGTIDMALINHADTLSTRLRSINQLLVLSFIEFGFIWYLLIEFRRREFSLIDIFTVIILAGILQGIFALFAFLVPELRNLFMTFGDKNLYENSYYRERRGYGFSINLIDTFGYGMGLIAGYTLIIPWTKNKIKKWLALLILLFTIVVNARTGIVIFLIAIVVKVFINRSIGKTLLYTAIAILAAIWLGSLIPFIIDLGLNSKNATISWISNSFNDMYLLLSVGNPNQMELDEVGFLDNFIGLPDNLYELIFGTGHHVYDTNKTLGFRTDIGYLNLFWEFGIIGGATLLITLFWFIIKPAFTTTNTIIRRISIFNLFSYVLVLMKAILIGFNPGVFINYTATFCLYYCLYNNKHIAEKKCVNNHLSQL